MILHKGPLDIIVHGVSLFWYGTIATPVTSRYLNPWYLVLSPSLQQQPIGSKVETHMLSVWFETLSGYPNARSPSTGFLINLDDAIWVT